MSNDPFPDYDSLDAGIAPYVRFLQGEGVETFASCQGGPGHPYPEPTIRFHGDRSEGFRVLGVALLYKLPVDTLRRIWPVIDGEPTGPSWEIVFDVQGR